MRADQITNRISICRGFLLILSITGGNQYDKAEKIFTS